MKNYILEEKYIMKFRLKELLTGLALMVIACLMAIALVSSATAQSPASTQAHAAAQAKAGTAKGLTAGEFFKNVTTPTLKGLSPSDFLGAMGVMTAAVGYDC